MTNIFASIFGMFRGTKEHSSASREGVRDFAECGAKGAPLAEEDAYRIAPLTLAFVGDSVYDLYVRTLCAQSSRADAGRLHRTATQFVNAAAQARHAKEILDSLKEREKDVFLRARNAKPGSVPKNMRVADYHYATGLEAVCGYLFLSGQTDRLEQLLGLIAESVRAHARQNAGNKTEQKGAK